MLAVTQYTGAQAQVGFGRVYFPGPNRVGARAHFMRWVQPILRLSRGIAPGLMTGWPALTHVNFSEIDVKSVS